MSNTSTNLNKKISQRLDELLEEGLNTGRSLFVDCLILNSRGQVFAQKRSSDRLKFPNCWDLPGGGIEKGESIQVAAQRELLEELNFELESIVTILDVFDFDLPKSMQKPGENYQFRVFQLLVKVIDYSKPILEVGKAVKYDWFDESNIETLMEGRSKEVADDRYLVDTVRKALDWNKKIKD
ncbi:MAG: NUDIX hydrolase [Patescibacteria group bacterium]